jgi:PAS domain S-box-containing protein
MTISTLHEGRYLETNEAFLGMVGYRREEILGKTTEELGIWIEARDRARLLQELESFSPVRTFGTHFRRKSGEAVEVELSADKIQLQGRTCLLVITRDLSEHRRLEQQFYFAQKMEALGQLAAGVAHDFKNYLMVIGMNAEMLTLNDEKNLARQDQISAAVKKADRLTNELLAYSRRHDIHPEVLDVNAMMAEICRMISNIMGKGVKIEALLEATWKIHADRGQMEQVLMNLAVNARDAMPSGGGFRLETRDLAVRTDVVAGTGRVPIGDYVQLVVADTGEGMTESTRRRIFEPFFTTKKRGKGTGLGLAAVYAIIKQHGGFIFVESEIGVGTTFRILLPSYAPGN